MIIDRDFHIINHQPCLYSFKVYTIKDLNYKRFKKYIFLINSPIEKEFNNNLKINI